MYSLAIQARRSLGSLHWRKHASWMNRLKMDGRKVEKRRNYLRIIGPIIVRGLWWGQNMCHLHRTWRHWHNFVYLGKKQKIHDFQYLAFFLGNYNWLGWESQCRKTHSDALSKVVWKVNPGADVSLINNPYGYTVCLPNITVPAFTCRYYYIHLTRL